MSSYDWRLFLEEWSQEILAYDDEYRLELPAEVIASGWLGYPGATEEQIAQAEGRLGTRLPPSYREFLAVTNGWRRTSPFIDRLWSTDEIEWFPVRHQGWIDDLRSVEPVDGPTPFSEEEYLVYGPGQNTLLAPLEYLETALDISDLGDAAVYVLSPQVVTAEGEWEAWFMAAWSAGASRYRSFWELMHQEHETFLRLRKR